MWARWAGPVHRRLGSCVPRQMSFWPWAPAWVISPPSSTIDTSSRGPVSFQVDIEAQEVGRHYPVTVGILGDAKAVLNALLECLRESPPVKEEGSWQREAEELRSKRLARLEEEGSLSTLPVKPQRVYYELERALSPETLVVLDGCACCAYGYDRLKFTHPGTFFAPLNLGTVGFALPVALGTKLARPQAPVLAIQGDGGYLYNSQEMETAVREGIPVVSLVMNNNGWGSEKAYQRDEFPGRYIGVDLLNPRFDKYAELFGARGFYVERPEEIGETLREAFSLQVPSVIEVPVDPDEFPSPTKIFS